MAHLSRALSALVLLLTIGIWLAPAPAAQGPPAISAIDVASGSQIFRLGDQSTSAIRMFIVGSNTTLQTTASVTVDSVTVVNVVSVTALSPLPTTATLSASSLTVKQDVGSTPWSVTALTPLPVSGAFTVSSATVKQDLGSSPWVVSWSGTNNVLAYPTGIYSVTALTPLAVSGAFTVSSVTVVNVVSTSEVGPQSVVFSGTQNVLSYPTGVYATTQGVQTVIFSGTQNVLAYPTGVQAITTTTPITTTQGTSPWVISWSGTNNVLAYPTGIYSITALTPLNTTATLSASSLTVKQDVGSYPWSVTVANNLAVDARHGASVPDSGPLLHAYASTTLPTAVTSASAVRLWADLNGRLQIIAAQSGVYSITALSPLPTNVNVTIASATVRQDAGSSPWVTSFSTTQNVLAYPTGVQNVTVINDLAIDAVHGAAVVATGPQFVAAASSAPPTAVTSGSAVRLWADLNGRLQIIAAQSGVYSITALSPLPTTATLTASSLTVRQDVGSAPWSVTALTPLAVSGAMTVSSATVKQDLGSVPWVMSWSGTNNVLAYPTGVYSITALSPLPTTATLSASSLTVKQDIGSAPWSVTALTPLAGSGAFTVTSATVKQDIGSAPWSVTALTPLAVSGISISSVTVVNVVSTTQSGPFSVVTSGTQNIRTLASGIDTVTTVPSGTQNIRTLSAAIDAVKVGDGTSTWQLDPCQQNGAAKTSTPISINGINNTRIITAASAKYTYICSMVLFAAGTVNVGIVEGTGNQCATNTTGIIGNATAATGLQLIAQTGFTLGNGAAFVAASSHTGYDFCLITSATQQLSGVITSVQR